MANSYYTIMIVPEKTSHVRKLLVPSWLLKGIAVGVAFALMIAMVMVFDYWFVMNQIGENKQLKMENRRLRQQVQVFRNKMDTIESTMDRVRTFATRLKVITNIEDRGGLLQSLNSNPATKIPDAATNVALNPGVPHPAAVAETAVPAAFGPVPEPAAQPPSQSAETATSPTSTDPTANASQYLENPEDITLRKEYEELDDRFTLINHDTLLVEQMLQDEYELLADQKSFLAALPTRKPAVGYFTSGFGIRKAPIGGRVKMHEGLDIANRPGTVIRAPADGLVVFSETKSGYGQTVILDHGYGLQTWFGHIKKLLVAKGQHIHRGDQIALLGNTGRSTGPHVHYEVRVNGTPVDPLSYILEN